MGNNGSLCDGDYNEKKKRKKNTRKRAFIDISSDDTQSPLAKKPKIEQSNKQKDEECCNRIFKCIQSSEMSNKLNIPSYINQIIAEYGTGDVKSCRNGKCDSQIVVLYQDKDNHKNNISYKYCLITNTYFCIHCMKDVIPINTPHLCDDCDGVLDNCKQLFHTGDLQRCNGTRHLFDNRVERCPNFVFDTNAHDIDSDSCYCEDCEVCQNYKFCRYCTSFGIPYDYLNRCVNCELLICSSCEKAEYLTEKVCVNCDVDSIVTNI